MRIHLTVQKCRKKEKLVFRCTGYVNSEYAELGEGETATLAVANCLKRIAEAFALERITVNIDDETPFESLPEICDLQALHYVDVKLSI